MGLAPSEPLQARFKLVPDKFVTRITYLGKLIGTRSLAVAMQLELFWLSLMKDLSELTSVDFYSCSLPVIYTVCG